MLDHDRRIQVYRDFSGPNRQSPQRRPLPSLFHFVRFLLLPSLLFLFFLSIIWTIIHDINTEYRKTITENQNLIAQCEKEYKVNKCGQTSRIPPALVKYCEDREDCPHQHPFDVTKSAVAARYLGQLVDEFVGSLSVRTIVTILAIVGATFWLMRLAPFSH
jgi:hypothetical protein